MKKSKKYFTCLLLVILTFTGCSSKHPSVKTGTIIGSTTGVIVGGVLGAALSNTHPGNGNTLEGVLIVGAILGIIGAGLGAGTGYVVDSFTEKNIEIEEIQRESKLMEIQ